jgi:hypothetical protein
MTKKVKIIQVLQDIDPQANYTWYGLGDDGALYEGHWGEGQWELRIGPNCLPEREPQKCTDTQILESIKTRGGGFESALAEACLHADSENLSKIKAAFSELWREHDESLEVSLRKAFSQLKLKE